jgi:AcrR family transcriptional regulator
VRKGELTHRSILDHAVGLASQIGLDGLSVGRLADDLGLSKSGLFGHFRSMEALQVQVLQRASEHFVDAVIRPAVKAPRGEPRLRALFDRWLDWGKGLSLPGGCLFVAAATELDDRPGPVREQLVRTQRDWIAFIAGAVAIAVEEGHFRRDVDSGQFAYDVYGIMLAWNHSSRLLGDPAADRHARTAFDNLLGAARPLRKRAR